eukprot:jgi/Ulvmu1/2211/UM013_0057.1
MQFLKHREQWFASVLSELDETSVPDYVRTLTDAHRSHMFDIVMQFRAIFYDGDDVPAAAPDAAAPEPRHAPGKLPDTTTGGAVAVSPVLASWAQHRAQLYVEQLDALLATVQDGSTLGTLVEAAMHCGRSLSRVGLDFRGPLAACVSRAAHGLFRSHIARASAMLSSSIDMHKWVAMPTSRVVALETGGGGGAAAAALADATPLLMQHPPLAVFVNAIITALNAVRSVALASIAAACAVDVREAVRDGAAMLAHVPSARKLSASERAVHHAACRCMHDTLCPLVVTLFQQMIGGAGTAPDLSDAAVPLKGLLAEPGDAAPKPAAAAHAAPPRHPASAGAAGGSPRDTLGGAAAAWQPHAPAADDPS